LKVYDELMGFWGVWKRKGMEERYEGLDWGERRRWKWL